MNKNIEQVQEELKLRGYRRSSVRAEILQLLASSQQPLTVAELTEELNGRGLQPNKTTIYREIETLVKEAILLEVNLLDGKLRYELPKGEHHHHHLVCKGCGQVQCIEIEADVQTIENQLSTKYNFVISGHIVEFFGTCSVCKG